MAETGHKRMFPEREERVVSPEDLEQSPQEILNEIAQKEKAIRLSKYSEFSDETAIMVVDGERVEVTYNNEAFTEAQRDEFVDAWLAERNLWLLEAKGYELEVEAPTPLPEGASFEDIRGWNNGILDAIAEYQKEILSMELTMQERPDEAAKIEEAINQREVVIQMHRALLEQNREDIGRQERAAELSPEEVGSHNTEIRAKLAAYEVELAGIKGKISRVRAQGGSLGSKEVLFKREAEIENTIEKLQRDILPEALPIALKRYENVLTPALYNEALNNSSINGEGRETALQRVDNARREVYLEQIHQAAEDYLVEAKEQLGFVGNVPDLLEETAGVYVLAEPPRETQLLGTALISAIDARKGVDRQIVDITPEPLQLVMVDDLPESDTPDGPSPELEKLWDEQRARLDELRAQGYMDVKGPLSQKLARERAAKSSTERRYGYPEDWVGGEIPDEAIDATIASTLSVYEGLSAEEAAEDLESVIGDLVAFQEWISRGAKPQEAKQLFNDLLNEFGDGYGAKDIQKIVDGLKAQLAKYLSGEAPPGMPALPAVEEPLTPEAPVGPEAAAAAVEAYEEQVEAPSGIWASLKGKAGKALGKVSPYLPWMKERMTGTTTMGLTTLHKAERFRDISNKLGAQIEDLNLDTYVNTHQEMWDPQGRDLPPEAVMNLLVERLEHNEAKVQEIMTAVKAQLMEEMGTYTKKKWFGLFGKEVEAKQYTPEIIAQEVITPEKLAAFETALRELMTKEQNTELIVTAEDYTALIRKHLDEDWYKRYFYAGIEAAIAVGTGKGIYGLLQRGWEAGAATLGGEAAAEGIGDLAGGAVAEEVIPDLAGGAAVEGTVIAGEPIIEGALNLDAAMEGTYRVTETGWSDGAREFAIQAGLDPSQIGDETLGRMANAAARAEGAGLQSSFEQVGLWDSVSGEPVSDFMVGGTAGGGEGAVQPFLVENLVWPEGTAEVFGGEREFSSLAWDTMTQARDITPAGEEAFKRVLQARIDAGMASV